MRDVIEIETKRLKLRGVRMSDAQRIARFCDDPKRWAHAGANAVALSRGRGGGLDHD